MFVIFSAKMFSKFTGSFQKNEPLIHLMYGEIKLLIEQLALRFLKKEVLSDILLIEKHNIETLFVNEKMLPLKEIDVGFDTREELIKISGNEDQLVFLHAARTHYIAALKHILKTIPITGKEPLLKSFRCLHPVYYKDASVKQFLILLKASPLQEDPDLFLNEYKLLQTDSGTPIYSNERVDHYWNKVFSTMKRENGELKYVYLPLLFKCLLCVSHGNSDVERGFSRSGKVLTADRANMDEHTLNSILLVSFGLSILYNNDIKKVSIDKEMLRLASVAHKAYENYLECKKNENKQRIEKEKESQSQQLELCKKTVEEKLALKNMEEKIEEINKQEKNKEKICDRLLSEANRKLERALKHNDLVEANIAKSMLESARKTREEEVKLKQQQEKLQVNVNKRTSSLLDSFVKKIPRIK